VISLSSFILEYNEIKGYFLVKADEIVDCPLCNGDLKYRDSVFRNLKDLASEVMRLLLRRLLCLTCKTLHRELPDIVQPYKHYSSDVIQAVIDEEEETSQCAADNATIKRWKTEFKSNEPVIKQGLSSVYARMIDDTVPISDTDNILDRIRNRENRWLPFVMNLLINTGHKTCTEFAFFPPGISATVGSAIKINAERGRKDVKTIKDTS
jgi:hypothetical protein